MRRSLKSRTAKSLKWNVVDRLSTQVLYAVTGIVLANELSSDDFGLVGAVLIFQAFASLLVDSGFSYALLQRQRPTRLDYSSVFWFNLGVAVVLYVLLWFGAPLIAACFENDTRLLPLSRVMFLSLPLSAAVIVQTNRLMKAMEVRLIAVSNGIGLAVGGVVGIWAAVSGFGAWAIVWQTLATGICKATVLWTATGWRPLMRFSMKSLRSFFGIGWRMMLTSALNTVFLSINSFFIGNRVGLSSLGYYTQADKWSKMGVTSITQILTSTFVPALAAVQDDGERFRRICSKISRSTAYLLFPVLIGLMVMAEPVFHTLFGTKWDPAITLFRLLLLRGVFIVLNTLYNNYMLSLGHAGTILRLEVVRDCTALAALLASLPVIAWERPDNIVYGLELMMWGQVAASAVTWIVTLLYTARATGISVGRNLADLAPYLGLTTVIAPVMYAVSCTVEPAWAKLALEAVVGAGSYLLLNRALGSRIQAEFLSRLRVR